MLVSVTSFTFGVMIMANSIFIKQYFFIVKQ
ncbi:hypothetical protein EDD57_1504 [Baia soyae]|uniref:Uncharacterized protein n=1 Tax=Baia soyae TaxID=1544746 RepID=A0A4R2RWN4_9BACL|nr:hypothetical protein EDD57_1504 [Baia soyae]